MPKRPVTINAALIQGEPNPWLLLDSKGAPEDAQEVTVTSFVHPDQWGGATWYLQVPESSEQSPGQSHSQLCVMPAKWGFDESSHGGPVDGWLRIVTPIVVRDVQEMWLLLE